jgi:hypothetical protein
MGAVPVVSTLQRQKAPPFGAFCGKDATDSWFFPSRVGSGKDSQQQKGAGLWGLNPKW